jgi:hypothetical protein
MAADRKNRRQYKKKSSEDITLSAIRPYIKLLRDTTGLRDQEKKNQIGK